MLTLPTKLGESKKRWLLKEIKLTLWEISVFHCKEWWAASLFHIIFRSFWNHCPISLWIRASLILNLHGCYQEAGALWLFALTPKKVTNKLINPIYLFWGRVTHLLIACPKFTVGNIFCGWAALFRNNFIIFAGTIILK